jgi:N-acetylglucosaminyldiphosphoundecaprenol N-acetyl-beta-D-mannosaminyltransferase
MTVGPPVFGRNVHCLLGLPFDAVDIASAVARVRTAANEGPPCFLSTPNLNFLIACRDDTAFRDSVIMSDLSVADGMPLVWIARLLGLPIRERVAGSSLFEALRRDVSRPLSVYFFGGSPGVAEQACKRLNAEAGGLRCVGFECPGFGSVEDMSSVATIDRINASSADFVVVALGARKGQAWIERNRSRLSAPVISHLGAVVGFVAGTVSRAPAWMQKTGLEWLWRIKEEPDLWRRYFGDGLALARLLATRVLPLTVYLRCCRPRRRDLDGASIMTTSLPNGGSILRLGGAWTADNLAPLRTAFAAAANVGADVTLHLGEITYVDSAAIGLLMLLHGHAVRCGGRFAIEGATDPVRRLLELNCAGFLLSPRYPVQNRQGNISAQTVIEIESWNPP